MDFVKPVIRRLQPVKPALKLAVANADLEMSVHLDYTFMTEIAVNRNFRLQLGVPE